MSVRFSAGWRRGAIEEEEEEEEAECRVSGCVYIVIFSFKVTQNVFRSRARVCSTGKSEDRSRCVNCTLYTKQAGLEAKNNNCERSELSGVFIGTDFRKMQASGERRRVLHRRPRLCIVPIY